MRLTWMRLTWMRLTWMRLTWMRLTWMRLTWMRLTWMRITWMWNGQCKTGLCPNLKDSAFVCRFVSINQSNGVVMRRSHLYTARY